MPATLSLCAARTIRAVNGESEIVSAGLARDKLPDQRAVRSAVSQLTFSARAEHHHHLGKSGSPLAFHALHLATHGQSCIDCGRFVRMGLAALGALLFRHPIA